MFLKSKVIRPGVPDGVIDRRALYARLTGWRDARAILVHAPAGYGKSTLVSRWIDVAGLAERAAWLSLDQDDADPRLFVLYLAAAVEQGMPGTLEAMLPILDDPRGHPSHGLRLLLATLETRLDALPAADRQLTVVLDDLHRVESPGVGELLQMMLERGPAGLQMILLARPVTALPLARAYSQGLIRTLTVNDLRFSVAEVEEYLEGMGYPAPPAADVRKVTERTEGWIGAIQLGVLAQPDRTSVADLYAALQGDNQWLTQYLLDEVLHHLSDDDRRFLLETSILDAFNARLCAAVTGMDDAADRLAALAASNRFLIPLDQEQGWFRYHHLFQELLHYQLTVELDAPAIALLRRRAAEWLVAADQPEAAVDQLLAADEMVAASEVVDTVVRAITQYEPHRALRLLNRLPAVEVRRQPRLILDRCRVAIQLDDAEIVTYFTRGQHALGDLTDPTLQAEALLYSTMVLFLQSANQRALESAARVETLASQLDDFLLGILHFILMHLHFRTGNIDPAVAYGEQALSIFERFEYAPGPIAIHRELAKWRMRHGDAQGANRRFRWFLAKNPAGGPSTTWELILANHAAAENSFWQQRTDEALAYQQAMLAAARTFGDESMVHLSEFLGMMYGGDDGSLAEHYGSDAALIQLAREQSLPTHANEVVIRWLVATGQNERVWRVAEEIGVMARMNSSDLKNRVLVPYGLACLARGSNLSASLPPLADALAERRATGNLFGELYLLALTAWLNLQCRDRAAAMATLAQANQLARETGYVGVIPTIPALTPLCRELEMFPHAKANAIHLTEQEQRVLDLLAAGHTYDEIGSELVVSVNTVRTHIRNLYRKLAVSRRVQAVEAAQEHGLLST